MKVVTLLYAYYNNPQMLRRQIVEWAKYGQETLDEVNFIVVDDGSMEAPALDALAAEKYAINVLDITVYRVTIDRPWGQDAARNIGMHHAETSWVLMSDMDHVLSFRESAKMLDFVKHRAVRGNYYMPRRQRVGGAPYHPHPNTFVFHREDFWSMGGYDEDFVGYYGSDGNFRKCARGLGLMEKSCEEFKMTLFGIDAIPDANTRTLTRKEGDLYAAKNRVLNAKRTGPPYMAVNPLRAPFQKVFG